jgi:hypothetical protein
MIHVQTPLYNFDYSYPAAAGRIPALKAWLDHDAASWQAYVAADAGEAFYRAKLGGPPFVGSNTRTVWQVVADLPGWLSLSGSTEAHGQLIAQPDQAPTSWDHGPMALLWDKTANRRVEVVDLFVSQAALLEAIREPFCTALNRRRAKTRGAPVEAMSAAPFDTCLDPARKGHIILGSADHAHFTRIGVLLGPYAMGSYAEGDYDVTLPVTPAVLSAVRPEYRKAFALASTTVESRGGT